MHMYHNETLKYFTEISQMLFMFFYFFMRVYVLKSFILETQSTYVSLWRAYTGFAFAIVNSLGVAMGSRACI